METLKNNQGTVLLIAVAIVLITVSVLLMPYMK